MRRRIYWLLPDAASARKTMDDMLLARIHESHIHFVGREDTDFSGLHAANILQTSDILPAAQIGSLVGAVTGALAGGLLAWYIPAGSGPPPWSLVIVLALVGTAFGAWASSMTGVSVPSRRLRRFQSAIEQGQLLLMVDVPHHRVREIEAKLQALHPEAHLEGVEPNIPAFP